VPARSLILTAGLEAFLVCETCSLIFQLAGTAWRLKLAVAEMYVQGVSTRKVTQPMLDLKRLYWNCHRFRNGPRQEACPYEVLGLDLPTYDFWTLLQTDPRELTQRLSIARNAE
jgi:hypothetical protein